MWSKLFKLIKETFKSGELPLDYVKCIIIPIPKKSTANRCDQYRTISSLIYLSKILTFYYVNKNGKYDRSNIVRRPVWVQIKHGYKKSNCTKNNY